MSRLALAAILIAYLPGALLFRLPSRHRDARAQLDAAERVFWHVILSLCWSLGVVLVLAAADRYQFDRLLVANAGLAAGLVLLGRGGLRYRGTATRVRWTDAWPIVLVALGVWRFFPSSEYIIGGKDPGVYVNEGVEIAQRGSLAMHDAVVAAVPPFARPLFFPPSQSANYFSNRFMGVFLDDPTTGRSMGQFPHLYPASIAIGYGLDGLTAVRMTVGVWAILGLLAVYFASVPIVGRPAACAASGLLALNVIELWFARSPGVEPAQQALGFAALLAFARAREGRIRAFAPVAAILATLLLFLRLDALMVIAAMIGAIGLRWAIERERPPAAFLLPLAVGAAIAAVYWTGPMRASLELPQVYLANLPTVAIVGGAIAAIAAAVGLARLARRSRDKAWHVVAIGIAASTVAAAAYAYWLRRPIGRLADYDAYALRTFAAFDVGRLGLAAAIAGLAIVLRRVLVRNATLVLTVLGFGAFLFYKIHVVAVHFWMDRRFVPFLLPGTLIFAAAAGLGAPIGWRGWRGVRASIGLAVVAVMGWQYAVRAAPLISYVEYEGLIPKIEQLASTIGPRDLVLVESRDAGSDIHVLALPLAEIYAKQVLVFNSARPDKRMLEAFLEDARARYARILFVGGGGTDLLSRRIQARPIANGRLKIAEYAETKWDVFPDGPRRKDFDYSVYELTVGDRATTGFSLDIGDRDDLNVVRFYAKETTEGRTIRWTGPQSFIAVPGLSGREREVVLVMHDGGRPKNAPPARLTVYFNSTLLGTIDVGSGFHAYTLPLPEAVARAAAASDDPAELRLVSTTWVPRQYLGGTDDRALGVMLDRVEVR